MGTSSMDRGLTNGWETPAVADRGWVEHSALQAELAGADLLLLPVGFAENSRFYSQTSFPSKLADYLAAGTTLRKSVASTASGLSDLDCDCSTTQEPSRRMSGLLPLLHEICATALASDRD